MSPTNASLYHHCTYMPVSGAPVSCCPFLDRKVATSAVAIERGSTARVVMLSAAEYERLMRLDPAALAPGNWTDEAVHSLVAAKASPSAFLLNKLLDSGLGTGADFPFSGEWLDPLE